MKKSLLLLCSFVFCASASLLHAQSEAEMKAWQTFMTPGDVHKMMASWDGDWVGDITMWMDANAPAMKSSSTNLNRMIMGGRYQEARHSGNFMGMPFEGLSTTGWDNGRKLFVSTWVDNMGTGVMYLEGPWDDKTKSMIMTGTTTDPMTGKSMPIRQVMKIVDANTQILEQYNTHNGKEFKAMEIRFTRKK